MVTNIEALKSQSIVSVIERYIPLRKNGANFIACCPFHSEKSPSFVVSEAKGMFKCFGCGKGGDALTFIKEYERIDFNEAVKRLSELTGIALEYDSTQTQPKSPHEVLEKINALAKSELRKNTAIVEYLAQRGLTQELCEKYDIGLVPSKQELLKHFSAADLIESGFANATSAYGLPRGASTARNDRETNAQARKVDSSKNEQSNNSSQVTRRQDFGDRIGALQAARGDKTDGLSHKRGAGIADSSPKANAQNITIPMHHRIGIVIRNPQHKIVAFVARTHPHYSFPPNAPKYINSKESYFYKKAQILYLYSHARAAITQSKAAFIVEGYIDSILLHENGFKNALATGGTAFNLQHLNLLTKLDCEVIFCFDNDKSGMAANYRAVKVCFNAGFYRVKVAILQNRDESGKRCKDINEAIISCATGAKAPTQVLHSQAEPASAPKAGLCQAQAERKQTCGEQEARNLTNSQAAGFCDDFGGFQAGGAGILLGVNEQAHRAESTKSAQKPTPKLDFNYLSGYEFFIKWLYKNKDKQSAFSEIKAAINACQNFYDKQEFLDTACKLTGVPSEYFTQDKLPARAQGDDYSKLIASILHSEECAYIASELDLSFIPQHKQLQAFLHTGENKELASFIESKPLDTASFYQHYCDLYLAHLAKELEKAKARKDLGLVCALGEKIAEIRQSIKIAKMF